MKHQKDTCIYWLLENKYSEVAELIVNVMNDWKKNGNKQRRNWWEILAGDKNGKSRVINGITFPVLKAAQIRMKKSITDNAICLNKHEKLPPERKNTRWK